MVHTPVNFDAMAMSPVIEYEVVKVMIAARSFHETVFTMVRQCES
jgi:hypothetical protein